MKVISKIFKGLGEKKLIGLQDIKNGFYILTPEAYEKKENELNKLREEVDLLRKQFEEVKKENERLTPIANGKVIEYFRTIFGNKSYELVFEDTETE